MEKWRGWLRFKRSLVFPMKFIVLKVKVRLRPKAQEKRQGLLGLYKDMECCGEYEDIQVMPSVIIWLPESYSRFLGTPRVVVVNTGLYCSLATRELFRDHTKRTIPTYGYYVGATFPGETRVACRLTGRDIFHED
ncbi:Ribosomal protein S4 (RPS4A) family protein [Hibiscus syriacus]|uniref:Ribosomal protein S4 (RPS4A) family protein n=1 Tax=Hibiscus syriacus TaxID=106335 RepID=A0A6A2ZMK6_HIBSY|nr:Ribosomal protein S4 (RPS4A) family protein [Hibiscus syriacus]